MRVLIAAAALQIAGCASAPVQAPSYATHVVPPAITEAVVRLERRLDGEHTGTCAATFIASDLLATAGHCVEDASAGQLRFLSPGESWSKVLEVVGVGGVFEGETIDPERGKEDWAVVRVEPTTRHPITVAPLKSGELDSLARLRTPIYVYGYSGTGKRLTETGPCALHPNHYDGFFATNCQSHQGDSGGPVLLMTEDGPRLIAVHSGSNDQGSFEISAAQFVHLLP